MNSNKGISLLAAVSVIAVLISAALIATSHEEASASVFATCENNCPDGGKVRCSGEDVATINDPADPGCICDEKEYRCSDRKKKHEDEKKSADKRKSEGKKSKKKEAPPKKREDKSVDKNPKRRTILRKNTKSKFKDKNEEKNNLRRKKSMRENPKQ